MIDPDEQVPYRVEPDGGRFKVVDWNEGTVLICGDEPSAGQYAALMNEAYRRGFKAGIRKARSSHRTVRPRPTTSFPGTASPTSAS